MRYRTGEMAEFFGMTKEGIRYLERQGLITSRRDEQNRYRYFSRSEITRLKEIRSYQALGFSLEEAARIVCRTPREELLSRMDEKLSELEKKEEQIRQMRTTLQERRGVVARMLDTQEAFELVMRPEILFFNHVSDEASGESAREKEAIAHARAVEKTWIRAMPAVGFWAMHCDASGQTVQGIYGSGASLDTVRRLGLPVLGEMVHLEPCLCMRGVLEARGTQVGDVTALLKRAQAHGYTLCGDVYGQMHVHYLSETGERMAIHEMFVPVCEKTIKNA